MEKIAILWLDMRSSDQSVTARPIFDQYFSVYNVHQPLSIAQCDVVGGRTPSLICFDFDYPDLDGLALLREIRYQYPEVPVLLMTEQHSEALAVWALRMRVLDYLVKPMSREDTRLAAREIKATVEQCDQLHVASPLPQAPPKIPDEARFHSSSSTESKALQPAISYIHHHIADKISESEMAHLCHMRSFQFSRNFKKVLKVTFQEYLQRCRIQEACRLLKNPDSTVLEVAISTGFSDQSYFCRVFKKFTGHSPSTYRDKLPQETAAEFDHSLLADNDQSPTVTPFAVPLAANQ